MIKRWLDKVPPIFKNFYILVACGFVVWVLFFDKNDLITHFRLKSELNEVEDQRNYYQDKIKLVEKNRNELEDNDELLEKFAREKYMMKKDNEDLYIIEFKTEE